MGLPSLEDLFDFSDSALQDLELSALNRAANLSKIAKRDIDSWIEQMAAGMVTQWFRENRSKILRGDAVQAAPHKVEFLSDVKKSA